MNLKTSIRSAAKSRMFIVLGALTFVQMLILVVWVLTKLPLNTSDRWLQVVIHYSPFSSVINERGPWWYLLAFALFAVVVFILNLLISMKLLNEKGRTFALMYLWLTVIVLLVSTFLIAALLGTPN